MKRSTKTPLILMGAASLIGMAVIFVAPEKGADQNPQSPAAHTDESTNPIASIAAPAASLSGRTTRRPRTTTSPEIGEDAKSLDWDRLSESDRREYLDRRFSEAVALLEEGNPEAASAAEDALSALRPEMYGSEVGQTEYARLEKRLEDAQRPPNQEPSKGEE